MAGVHHHLIRQGVRTKVSLIVESGEPREVAHLALLIGYGAVAVNPYLAFETIRDMVGEDGDLAGVVDYETAEYNYVKAADKGILKIMSKMGISTIESYRGAQIFEAVGLNSEFIDQYFAWTPSRIGGIGIHEIELESRKRHEAAFQELALTGSLDLETGGYYQWRRDGEYHMVEPRHHQPVAACDQDEQLRVIPGVRGIREYV